MDDLQMIRETLTADPPSPHATADARRRLTAAMARRGQARPRFRRPLAWSLAGATVAAGVAGVVLMTATTPQQAGPPSAGVAGPRAPVELSAEDLLLAAATTAGRAETGRYWHVRAIHRFGPYRIGSPPDGYELVARSQVDQWVASNPRDRSERIERDLGHRPRAARDKAAWVADGSPRQWRVNADTVSGTVVWRMAPGDTEREGFHPGNYLQELGGFDAAQVRALPTDPAELQRRFLDRITTGPHATAANGPEADSRLFEAMTDLLIDVPAPPAVRAAAFKVLANIPGVRNMGTVTDAEDRPGVGIQLTREYSDLTTARRLIIDPKTLLILASDYGAEASDGSKRLVKEQNRVILTAEWTNEAPGS